MTINTNNILNNLQLNLAKISAQEKIDNPQDSADKILHDTLNSDMLQSQQEILNFNDAVGYMQVADGVLSNISSQTDELNTLSVAKNNAILSNDQKSIINSQMNDISYNISKTLNETTFNGKNVFNGNFRVGDLDVNLNLNSNSLDITNQESILEFQKNVNTLRGDIGAFMNSANSNVDNLSQKLVSEVNSKSNYEVDIANSITEINKDKLNLNASLIAQSHNSQLLSNQIQNLLN